MTELTEQQLAFADHLYRMLEAGRQGSETVVIVVVSEDDRVKKVIEEKRAVVCALAELRGFAPAENRLS